MSEIPCAVGALAVYRQAPAKITALADGKIELALPGGERKNVRAKDIIILHAGPVVALPSAMLNPPDLAEIVVMLEEETVAFADFTALIFGQNSPAAAWSAWRLLHDGIYFAGSIADGVRARPAAEIAAALENIAVKADSRRQREELLARIRSGKLLPEDCHHLRDVESLALGKTAASGILRQLNMEQSPEKAHRLLLDLGIWNCWKNPFPARAGIELHDPELPTPELPEVERLDLTGIPALAIDDEGNQDPDDAISCADGLLWVHVADVAALVAPGDAIDLEAETRGANLYLPERTVHMLPPGITARLGLGLAEISPALSFAIRFDDHGAPKLEKIARSRIRATRWSYEMAETRLDECPLLQMRPLLARFRQFREAAGALRIELPEVKIRVAGEQISIKALPPLQSREIVAEAMMAAGAALGRFAEEHELPMPFAVQPEPDVAGKPATLAGMFAARRGCNVTIAQTVPGKHCGLGLEPYVRVTSPLRRYGDLLAHQQLHRYLTGSPPLPATELDGKLAKSENAAADLRRLERLVNEFWKLVYLKFNPGWQGRAVVVERLGSRTTMLLPDLAYEYKLNSGKMELNSEWLAAVNAVDLPGLTARFTLFPAQASPSPA